MDLYSDTAYQLSRSLTLRYSTSFGTSSKLFPKEVSRHIYAVYGLVRIADEIVDTYKGKDVLQQLDSLEAQTFQAMKTGYSANPIVHAFALTANQFDFDAAHISAFFASMRMDVSPQVMDQSKYEEYIYGSAEVIGLMCLKVFCAEDKNRYKKLETGARSLGSAYQKINFLRDFASDFAERGRVYFPDTSYDEFNETAKMAIVTDIKKDLKSATQSVGQLPKSARRAVKLSLEYYSLLLTKLESTPVQKIKSNRIRISDIKKSSLFIRHFISESWR